MTLSRVTLFLWEKLSGQGRPQAWLGTSSWTQGSGKGDLGKSLRTCDSVRDLP